MKVTYANLDTTGFIFSSSLQQDQMHFENNIREETRK
jgi:hypothetical protein